MRSDPMLFKTTDGEERAEQIRMSLSASPEVLVAECTELTDRGAEKVDAAQKACKETMTCCEAERAAWMREICALIDAVPIPRAVFRVRMSERELAELCRRMARLERCERALGAAFSGFSETLRQLREADTLLCRAHSLIGRSIYEAAQMQIELPLHALDVRLDALDADLQQCVKTCREAREAWSGFCFDAVPKFLQAVRRTADLAGSGQDCDTAALHRILGEMRHRSERVF